MTRFNVPDMSCGHCKSAVERTVAFLDPEARTSVDLEGKIVEIDSSVSDTAIQEALAKEGYPASLAG